METRKIQEVGGGTYTVSLPKDWADAQGVEAGAVVNVHTHIDDLLVIQPRDHRDDATQRALVSVDRDDTDRLERTLRAAYAAGTEEILLVASDSFTRDQCRLVNRTAETLVGVTLDQESDSRILLRTLLDPEEVSVWQSVRQLQFVALSMHREATAALVGETAADAVPRRDDEADRLFAMIDRHFGRGLDRLDEVDALGLTRSELFEARAVARELERVGDHAERIVAVARDLDAPLDEPTADEIRALGETARTVVEDAGQCVIDDGDIGTAHEALATRDTTTADVTALETKLFEAGNERPRLVRALDSIRRTAQIGGNIGELRLRMATRCGEFADCPAEMDATTPGTPSHADGE